MPCRNLSADVLDCRINTLPLSSLSHTCTLGLPVTASCYAANDTVTCEGERAFNVSLVCGFCHQLPAAAYTCSSNTSCSVADRQTPVMVACTAKSDAFCLGRRTFPMLQRCNWSAGLRWSTTILLSITLGGFGAERFYLGQTGWALFKLFTFGGLGVWTLIDVFLSVVGYLSPTDGSALLRS